MIKLAVRAAVEAGNAILKIYGRDFEVEYRITDNVSLLAFNRSRDELIAMTAPYKQGMGVSYREEFNTLRQLLARYRDALTNRKKKKKKKSEKTDSEE